MEHLHLFSAENGVNLYERKYTDNGDYFVRGNCCGIKEGDTITSFLDKRSLLVKKVNLTRDAKGLWLNKKLQKNSYFEAILHDPEYDNDSVAQYTILGKI